MAQRFMFWATVAGATTFGYVAGAAAQLSQVVEYSRMPAILTGADIGFQQTSEGARTGKLMIRIDGRWVEAHFSEGPRMMPAK